jgi:A/G-specific adenine glycosylase
MNELTRRLITWYEENARELPWRHTTDPYRIWLSEIVLQQTQVKTGLKYYKRIVSEYPDVNSLANAKPDHFMKLWQGLGYYRRADNLLSTAQHIAQKLGGSFPDSYAGLLKLKGVGKYTAAAVASFAYHEPVPVVDGNVRRVVSRLFEISSVYGTPAFEKQIATALDGMFYTGNPALFNQAIMEFGALQCKKSPLCESCPLAAYCLSRKAGKQAELPVKKNNNARRVRQFCYLLYKEGRNVAIVKRGDSDIWRNLYEFPFVEVEACNRSAIAKKVRLEFGLHAPELVSLARMQSHILSHQEILASLFLLKGNRPKGVKMIDIKDLHDYPVHRLMDKMLHDPVVETILEQ